MHRALTRSYALARQLHSSAGRYAGSLTSQGAKSALMPARLRTGSLFDEEPEPEAKALSIPIPSTAAENAAAESDASGQQGKEGSELWAKQKSVVREEESQTEEMTRTSRQNGAREAPQQQSFVVPPQDEQARSQAYPVLNTLPPPADLAPEVRRTRELRTTLGRRTTDNLVLLFGLDLAEALWRECKKDDLDALMDWCRQNMFGHLRMEPKSTAHGMFTLSEFVIADTPGSVLLRHRLRQCGQIDLANAWRLMTGHPNPYEEPTLDPPEDSLYVGEGRAQPHEFYLFRLEHGDHKAHISLAYEQEYAMRHAIQRRPQEAEKARMLGVDEEEAEKRRQQELVESRRRLVEHLEEAGKHGFGDAYMKLAMLHEEGVLLPRNASAVVDYYERAIALGKQSAAAGLAKLYGTRLPTLSSNITEERLLPADRAKCLFYNEIAAPHVASAAAHAAMAYFRRHGASVQEHRVTYGVDPDDDKAARYMWMGIDKKSFMLFRYMADMLILDRADVPPERAGELGQAMPKRLRQLKWAVWMLGRIPGDWQKGRGFMNKRDESLRVARELLSQAERGLPAMLDEAEAERVMSWTGWAPSGEALRVRHKSLVRRLQDAGTSRIGRREAKELRDIEEQKKKVMMSTLLMKAKSKRDTLAQTARPAASSSQSA